MLIPLRVTLAASLLLAGCSAGVARPSADGTPSDASSPSAPDSASPTPDPSPTDSVDASPSASADAAEPVVVTFQVGGGSEEYRILLTDPEDIAIARALLAGEEELARIPNGLIVRGDDGGVNVGYSWHIDPNSLEFAEVTIEVCDGLPSYIEDGILSGDRFCPWSAEVVAVEAAG